jgi:hypothetical protein
LLFAPACGDSGPSIEEGETGSVIEWVDGCAPNFPLSGENEADDAPAGQIFTCQGIGNGWLETSVYPLANPRIDCVHYEGDPPETPTPADCAPLTFTMLPAEISPPLACCTAMTEPEDIVATCVIDCGFAACGLAVDKLHEAAANLPDQGAQGVIEGDLDALADFLAMPAILDECAEMVVEGNGAMIEFDSSSTLVEGRRVRWRSPHQKHDSPPPMCARRRRPLRRRARRRYL